MTAAAMTYDSLVEDIKNYAERSTDVDFVSQIPRLIMMAENRIATEVRGLGLVKIVSGALSINDSNLAKPERWRETATFIITDGTERKILFPRPYGYCRVFWPDTSVVDVPRFYADYGYEHYFIVPTPLSAYPLELTYFERPEPLSDSNQTNWTTQYAPQLLLYACMMEAMIYLKNDDRLATFQGQYGVASADVTAEAKRRVADASVITR